jgi:GNAT superfamily N-acetyltransferase
VTTWHLEMRTAGELRPAPVPVPAPQLVRAAHPCPAFSRFLYTAVGGDWHWTDRLGWSHAQWLAWLDRPVVQTWVLYVQGNPAGYMELETQAGANVEISYFGLLPAFTGRGLGGHLLSEGIRRAWEGGARRVWVHTCSLDAPAAYANYRARGMQLFRTEVSEKRLGPPPGPWPGARP